MNANGNQSRTYRWVRRGVWGTFALLCAIGCSPLQTIAFLTHKDPKIPAEAPLVFKEGPKKDKEEIVVAVFISQGGGQSVEFAGQEGTLASEIAKKLPELAKENKQKVVVIEPRKVNKFKMNNPNWKVMHPTAWGKELGADFVLDVHLERMSMFEPGSLKQFYEGRAEVTVDTYDVDAGPGEPKFNYPLNFKYPTTPRDVSAVPLGTFRKQFIENLAIDLCHKHVDYKTGSGIADGR